MTITLLYTFPLYSKISLSDSKFKAHYHDVVICPNCMSSTACNSVYCVRAAAACTTSKKQKYVIWNAPRDKQSVVHKNR